MTLILDNTKIDKASKRWVRNASDELALRNGCYFDEKAGLRVVNFFQNVLQLSVGQWAGKPFSLIQWQKDDLLVPMFGWKNAEHHRRFRVGYAQIAKKNGKSSLCAGVALYGLSADGEVGAEVYGLATDRHQGGIIFRHAASMVKASPALSRRLKVLHTVKRIVYEAENSFYQVLSADAFRNEGLDMSMGVFDELHAQPDRRLWDAVRYAGAARQQPLLLAITTAGVDSHSICYEQYDYGKKVLEGSIPDDQFFCYICEAGREDDWTKEETWRKANPSLGITINLNDFKTDCIEAQNKPSKENPFKRYRLNIWTEQAIRWIQMKQWNKCSGLPFDRTLLLKQPCFGGLDLAINRDIAALVLDFPMAGGRHLWLPFFWLPKDDMQERILRDKVPYDVWIREGFIEATPGNVIDYAYIRNRTKQIAEEYALQAIGYDPYNATHLVQELESDGLKMITFRQGFLSMSAPSKVFEMAVKSETLAHLDNPVLKWMAANAVVETDAAENIKPSKDPKKVHGRIDGIVAGIMGLGLSIAQPVESKQTSVYETRGIRQL